MSTPGIRVSVARGTYYSVLNNSISRKLEMMVYFIQNIQWDGERKNAIRALELP